MISLFIDTTQNNCNFALVDDKKILKSVSYPTLNNMTDLAVEKIELLLKENNVDKKNIKNIYCTIGPGSFTGCRVGIIIVKAWSLTFSVKIFYMNSLLLQLPDGTGISIIDAKSQKRYVAVYENFNQLFEPVIIFDSELENIFQNFVGKPIYEDYKNVDIFANFIGSIDHFEKANSIQELIPFYLKKPI